ncbi:MAG: scramblase [Elusimicrobia bacterium HGW-Elusimicrobia-3]|jgi:uncharacterized protein YxjI|nr:MAG: scramblase [Elusimicrobia bacterium HGW-Elusimicrobia-3]
MEKLKDVELLTVRQKKEWGEIITGFEARNRYAVYDGSGQQVYWAAEEGSMLARLVLKALRPFSLHILSADGRPAIKTEKPFRFYFHEMSVFTPDGRLIGNVKREFSLLQRNFHVTDAQGGEVCRISAALLHPWTFKVYIGGAEAGEILKNWSGLVKESFTDADNFSVAFPRAASAEHKALLLAALFLIDIVYFER